MPHAITPVILSGGSGTRLWPLSTDVKPKQFQPLLGQLSMFALTLGRCTGPQFAPPIIVGSARHADLAETELAAAGLSAQAHILEPSARNTAPAIALAALVSAPDALLLVMPSDHAMRDVPAFTAAVERAAPLAQQGWLVTFGITPAYAETGYGYIERGDPLASELFAARRFLEKPERAKAEAMLAQGGFFWNAGIFLFRADAYLAALVEYAPAMLSACEHALTSAERSDGRVLPGADAFAACPSDSIDYAVMEKSNRVALAPVDPGWSDIGSWDALAGLLPTRQDENVVHGNALCHEARGNLVHSDGPRVSLHGVEGLIVVVSGGEVMIVPRGQSQAVKILAGLAKENQN
jgi:mannose-1-phosphate guanylyltransferase/mannose-1-phosphate guanylyltransferase/mannose-6-phosphate isomerase